MQAIRTDCFPQTSFYFVERYLDFIIAKFIHSSLATKCDLDFANIFQSIFMGNQTLGLSIVLFELRIRFGIPFHSGAKQIKRIHFAETQQI